MLGRTLIAALLLAVAGAMPGCEDLLTRTIGVGSESSARAERTASVPGAGELSARLIALFPCASAAWSPTNPHHMSYGLHRRGGWARYMEGPVTEAVERFGYRRVMFHLPFGKATGQSPRAARQRATGRADKSLEAWHMGLDHAHDLRRTGNEWIADEFYAALARLHARHPDVEVIVYVGSWDAEDARIAEEQGIDEVMRRWHESIDPLVELDYVSIVFDAAVALPEDHPNARFVQWAQEQKRQQPGRFVGVEARIQKAHPWPNERCMADVAWEPTWRKQAHAGNIPGDQICGEVIRVIDGQARGLVAKDRQADVGAWLDLVADIVRDGDTPAVSAQTGPKMRLSPGVPTSTTDGPYRMPAQELARRLIERAGRP